MNQSDPLVAGQNRPANALAAARQRAHALIAKSHPATVQACFARMGDLPQTSPLRPTEIGLIMVRGRVGGDGPVSYTHLDVYKRQR